MRLFSDEKSRIYFVVVREKGAKRMGAKRMEVKTPVLTALHGLTEAFAWLCFERSCRA